MWVCRSRGDEAQPIEKNERYFEFDVCGCVHLVERQKRTRTRATSEEARFVEKCVVGGEGSGVEERDARDRTAVANT
jgi:hypothetical protein